MQVIVVFDETESKTRCTVISASYAIRYSEIGERSGTADVVEQQTQKIAFHLLWTHSIHAANTPGSKYTGIAVNFTATLATTPLLLNLCVVLWYIGVDESLCKIIMFTQLEEFGKRGLRGSIAGYSCSSGFIKVHALAVFKMD